MRNNYPPERWLLSCIALALLLSACKKNHYDDAKTYLVKEIYFDNTLEQSNEYDDAGRLIRVADYSTMHGQGIALNSVDSIFYNSDGKRQSIKSFHHEGPSFNTKSDFSYNGDGRLVEIRSYTLSTNALWYVDSFSYSGFTIVETQIHDGSVASVTTFTLNSDSNIVKAVSHNPSNVAMDYTEEWSDYDDKIGMTGPRVGDVASKNNPRSYKLTYSHGGNTQQSTMGYFYNHAGYIKERVVYQKGSISANVEKYVLVPGY